MNEKKRRVVEDTAKREGRENQKKSGGILPAIIYFIVPIKNRYLLFLAPYFSIQPESVSVSERKKKSRGNEWNDALLLPNNSYDSHRHHTNITMQVILWNGQIIKMIQLRSRKRKRERERREMAENEEVIRIGNERNNHHTIAF